MGKESGTRRAVFASTLLQRAPTFAGFVRQLTNGRTLFDGTTTIRLAEADLARARTLAADKGLRYQTYLEMLLHEALKNT